VKVLVILGLQEAAVMVGCTEVISMPESLKHCANGKGWEGGC
jgi:hypothetical protein